jgi:hypothetical protein
MPYILICNFSVVGMEDIELLDKVVVEGVELAIVLLVLGKLLPLLNLVFQWEILVLEEV